MEQNSVDIGCIKIKKYLKVIAKISRGEMKVANSYSDHHQ